MAPSSSLDMLSAPTAGVLRRQESDRLRETSQAGAGWSTGDCSQALAAKVTSAGGRLRDTLAHRLVTPEVYLGSHLPVNLSALITTSSLLDRRIPPHYTYKRSLEFSRHVRRVDASGFVL